MPCVLVRGCARRTNLYAAGAREPLLVSCPLHAGSHGAAVTSPVSLLDITPTILDWLQLPLPSYSIFRSAEENTDFSYWRGVNWSCEN